MFVPVVQVCPAPVMADASILSVSPKLAEYAWNRPVVLPVPSRNQAATLVTNRPASAPGSWKPSSLKVHSSLATTILPVARRIVASWLVKLNVAVTFGPGWPGMVSTWSTAVSTGYAVVTTFASTTGTDVNTGGRL